MPLHNLIEAGVQMAMGRMRRVGKSETKERGPWVAFGLGKVPAVRRDLERFLQRQGAGKRPSGR